MKNVRCQRTVDPILYFAKVRSMAIFRGLLAFIKLYCFKFALQSNDFTIIILIISKPNIILKETYKYEKGLPSLIKKNMYE